MRCYCSAFNVCILIFPNTAWYDFIFPQNKESDLNLIGELSFLLFSNQMNDIDINMEIQFGERVGHGGWLIGPKLFRPKAYASCASSKLCKFIVWLEIKSVQGKYEPDCSFKLN